MEREVHTKKPNESFTQRESSDWFSDQSPVWFHRWRWRGVWWRSCSIQDSWETLGRSIYYLSYLLLSYLSFTSELSFFRLLKLSDFGRVSMVWVREVPTQGVGWASQEVSDPVVPPLNLVLYMHLRIFAYTSNDLIVSYECTTMMMELILASGTLKNFRFLPLG
jgi:hypothetical protein